MILRLTNCRLCDEGKLLAEDLYIDQSSGRIVPKPMELEHIHTLDLEGRIVAPGYIDIQNNGIYGLNFLALNANSLPQDVARFKVFFKDCMAKYLKTGVTALCPTVTSSFPGVYKKVLPVYKRTRAPDMADSLGAHVEGPFINSAKKGCHPEETFVDGKDASFASIYGDNNLHENVAIVTAAPEIPGVMAEIPRLLENTNVVFSIGHTTLDLATCIQAITRGALMITHLYNAMPQPHHRQTGVVGLIGEPKTKDNAPYFGMICDGVHVAPSMCVLAYRANPERCVLVTDAMHLIGLPDGVYQWDKQRIVKSGPSLYLEGTTTLAGAATNLADCVKNLMRWTGITLAQAVRTVTNNAANSLKVSHKGYLKYGCDADLVILNDDGDVLQVYKLGKPVSFKASLTAVL